MCSMLCCVDMQAGKRHYNRDLNISRDSMAHMRCTTTAHRKNIATGSRQQFENTFPNHKKRRKNSTVRGWCYFVQPWPDKRQPTSMSCFTMMIPLALALTIWIPPTISDPSTIKVTHKDYPVVFKPVGGVKFREGIQYVHGVYSFKEAQDLLDQWNPENGALGKALEDKGRQKLKTANEKWNECLENWEKEIKRIQTEKDSERYRDKSGNFVPKKKAQAQPEELMKKLKAGEIQSAGLIRDNMLPLLGKSLQLMSEQNENDELGEESREFLDELLEMNLDNLISHLDMVCGQLDKKYYPHNKNVKDIVIPLVRFDVHSKLIEVAVGKNSLVSSEFEPLQHDGYSFPTATGMDWRATLVGQDLHFFAPYSLVRKSKSNFVRYDIFTVPKVVSGWIPMTLNAFEGHDEKVLIEDRLTNKTIIASGSQFVKHCKRRDSHVFRRPGDEYHCSTDLELDSSSDDYKCLLALFNDKPRQAAKQCKIAPLPRRFHVDYFKKLGGTEYLTTFLKTSNVTVRCGVSLKDEISNLIPAKESDSSMEFQAGTTQTLNFPAGCRFITTSLDAGVFTYHNNDMMMDKDYVKRNTRYRKLDFLDLLDGSNLQILDMAMGIMPPKLRTVANIRDEYKYARIINGLGLKKYALELRILLRDLGIITRVLFRTVTTTLVFTIVLWKFSDYTYFMLFDLVLPSKRFKTLLWAGALVSLVITFDFEYLKIFNLYDGRNSNKVAQD